MAVLAGRANKPRWGQWNCQRMGRLSSAPNKTAMLRRLGRGRWKISQNRIRNRKFRLQSVRWPLIRRGLFGIYINFKVVVHSEGNSWPLVSPTEFPSVMACKVSTFGSLYTCACRPWHHNSVPAHISLHSGLFKLSFIHIVQLSRGRRFENLVALFFDCHLFTDTAIQFSSGSH